MIPYVEKFLSQKEALELFEFCRNLPYLRPPNGRNPNVQIRKIGYQCYSVLPTSRTGMTAQGGGNNWLHNSPAEIQELAARLSAYRGMEINYLSILGYLDEHDHIGWHNHREDLKNEDQSVTVVNLGETRSLSLRPVGCRDKRLYEEFDTINGALYVLPHLYNRTHEHAILNDKRPRGLRISINCKSLSPADVERARKKAEIERLTVRTSPVQESFFGDEPRVWDCHAGKKYPADAIYVGRENGNWPATPFGNPHLKPAEFRAYAQEKMKDPAFAAKIAELKGKHLLCWCAPSEPWCHARVWLELANTIPETEPTAQIRQPQPQTEMFASTQALHTRTGLLLAKGYKRVVVGKRGPYIEMNKSQVVLENLHLITNAPHVYFDEYRSNDEANVMVYLQRQTVAYADYKVGLYYVSPADLANTKEAT